MAVKLRKVMVTIPKDKKEALEKFLLESKEKGIIKLALRHKAEITKISKDSRQEFEGFHYDVYVIGLNKEGEKFIKSLFANNLIPDGKEWTVFGPVRA